VRDHPINARSIASWFSIIGEIVSPDAAGLHCRINHFDRSQILVDVALLDQRDHPVFIYALEMDTEDAPTTTELILGKPNCFYFGLEPVVEIRLRGVVAVTTTVARRIEVHRRSPGGGHRSPPEPRCPPPTRRQMPDPLRTLTLSPDWRPQAHRR